MKWRIDPLTQAAARDFPLRINSKHPLAQVDGGTFNYKNWEKRTRSGDAFLPVPEGRNPDSPDQIIAEFQADHYLQALALVVSWGGMARRSGQIYRRRRQTIHDTLCECASSIASTNAIRESWPLLVGKLQWSSVMASKTLHFLCTALLPNDRHLPVPIDGVVVRNRVWWCFRHGVPEDKRPEDWKEDDLDAYERYMTAIITWADKRNWTTSQLEATIYAEYR
jgi:hypothetical protein